MQNISSKHLSDIAEEYPEKQLSNDRDSGTRPVAAGDDFPEGGWTAWATLIGGCVFRRPLHRTVDSNNSPLSRTDGLYNSALLGTPLSTLFVG